ncbi:MAG: IS110 family transposase [Gammaproteobacteria bacterium]|nr:IS110 family transposase [Gammaproteobacteria bacterium]
MKKSNVIVIDLAKNVLQVCKVSNHGELILNKAVSPNKLKQLLSTSSPAIVAMEGSGSRHYWCRLSKSFGHEVRIINPKKVKAFLQGQKTDANDALAIAMAATQFGVRFSAVKNEEQQTLQTLETSRKFLDKELTALNNHIRAYLYEYGITMRRGQKSLREKIALVLDDTDSTLPQCLKNTLRLLWERYQLTLAQLKETCNAKAALVKQVEPCKRLLALESVGEVCAAMLYANIGDGKEFKNGREASACIGLTPKQHSSGGKTNMMEINKKGGNKELRTALYQGALSVISRLPDEPRTVKQAWLIDLVNRAGTKRACIALANKTVRTAWALLATGKSYEPILISQ